MSQYDNANWVRAMIDNGITEETVVNIATKVIAKRLEMQKQENLHRQIKDIMKVIERKHESASSSQSRRTPNIVRT